MAENWGELETEDGRRSKYSSGIGIDADANADGIDSEKLYTNPTSRRGHIQT